MKQKQPMSKLTRTLLWLGGILGILVLVSADPTSRTARPSW